MKELMQKLGYQFNDSQLLKTALTHRSMKGKNNERLEFLGDAVLSFVIAHALYVQCPYAKEGDLSRFRSALVNGEALAEIAQAFELGNYLYLGPGELKSGGTRRKSILADALEAVIGAIYLDSDMLTCQERILAWFESHLKQVMQDDVQKDAKSQLQEYLQAHHLPLPQYEIISVAGEAHEQWFQVSCRVETCAHFSEGSGASRRAAEQVAAGRFLEWLIKEAKGK